MSEKRFTYGETIDYNFFDVFEEKKYLGMIQRDSTKIVDVLNEQQATIEQLQDLCGESDSENAKLRQEIKELKAQLREKEEDERLYANEIVKLNKEAKEVLDFKSLGGDY